MSSTPLRVLLAAALSLAPLGCSSSSTPNGGAGSPDASTRGDGAAATTGDGGFVPLPDSPTTFSMTGITIGPSSEAFKCTYVQMPATPGYVIGGNHEFTPGSHHLLLYRTALTAIPTGEGSPTIGDCYAPTADYMNNITGVVYPAQTPVGSVTMPEGVGLPYTGGEIMVFQVHYLNATAAPLSPEIYVHLDVQTTPVQQNAGVLFFYDPFIYVPQGGLATASTRCPIPENITLFTESSHYHSRGVNYQAIVDNAAADGGAATPGTSPFYTSDDWESPAQGTTSMQIAAGSDIRFYCYYNNQQGTQDYIQGQSALNNEMCMFVGLYYPAIDALDEQCQNGDMFGTGTVSCTDTLSCLNACPPESDDAGALATYSECTQKCFVQGCPGAADAIISVSNCVNTNCASQCATAGTTCDSCVTTQCASEYAACTNATCGSVPPAP